MARVNMEELRKEEESRNKEYIWEKDLIFNGRVIKDRIKNRSVANIKMRPLLHYPFRSNCGTIDYQ